MSHILRQRNQLDLPPSYPTSVAPTQQNALVRTTPPVKSSFESYQQQQLRSMSSFAPAEPEVAKQYQLLFSSPVAKLAVTPSETDANVLQITASYERMVNIIDEGEVVLHLCLPSGEPTRIIALITLASVIRIDLDGDFLVQLNMMVDPELGREPPPLILKLQQDQRVEFITVCCRHAPEAKLLDSKHLVAPPTAGEKGQAQRPPLQRLEDVRVSHSPSTFRGESPSSGSIRRTPLRDNGNNSRTSSPALYKSAQQVKNVLSAIKEFSGRSLSLLPPSIKSAGPEPSHLTSTRQERAHLNSAPQLAELNLYKRQLAEANALVGRLHDEIDRLNQRLQEKEQCMSDTQAELHRVIKRSTELEKDLVMAEKQIIRAGNIKKREAEEATSKLQEKQTRQIHQLQEALKDKIASQEKEKQSFERQIRKMLEKEIAEGFQDKIDALSQENDELQLVIAKNKEDFDRKEKTFFQELEAIRNAFLKYDEDVTQKLSRLGGENETLFRQNKSLIFALSPHKTSVVAEEADADPMHAPTAEDDTVVEAAEVPKKHQRKYRMRPPSHAAADAVGLKTNRNGPSHASPFAL